MKKIYTIIVSLLFFGTICAQAQILSEDFQGGSLPTGWTLTQAAGSDGWLFGAAQSTQYFPIPNHTIYACSNDDECNCDKSIDRLITPTINLSGVSSAVLTFDYYLHYGGGEWISSGSVEVSTNGGSTWTSILALESDVSAWTSTSVNLSAYAGQSNVKIAFHHDDHGTWGYGFAIDDVEITEPPSIEVALVDLDLPLYTLSGSNFNVGGTITNNGATTIISFAVSYTDNGGSPVTSTITGVNVPLSTSYTFVHPTPANISVDGTHTIALTISNFNGAGNDANTSDNSLSGSIIAASDVAPRTCLMEIFSTEPCPNCPPVDILMENYHNSHSSNTIMVVHHSGYYTDPYTIPESESPGYMDFYNDGGGTYAPAGMFDRYFNGEDNDEDGTNDPGPVFWCGSTYGTNFIDNRLATPAFVTVNLNGTYNSGTHALNLTVHGDFLADMLGTHGITVFITQDAISSTNQAGATTNPWIHHYVIRDVISSTWGDAITGATTSGSTFSKDYSFTVNSSWTYNNLYLVAFVNTIDAANINNRAVDNAVQVKLSDIMPLSTNEPLFETNVSIYPNPTSGEIFIANAENSDIYVYNVVGKLVASKTNAKMYDKIDLSSMASGSYVIKVVTGTEVVTKKITVTK